MLKLELPIPPSVNHYWLTAKGGRRFLCKQAHDYIWLTKEALQGRYSPLHGQLKMHVTIHFPDNRRRDVDNIAKCLLDSLQKAGAYNDDSQICDLHIVKGEKQKPGCVIVTLEEI